MIIDKKAVGNRIQSIRKRKGLTMKEFGKLVDNAAQSLVSRWENGLTYPNSKRLKIIAIIGGMTVNELLYGDFKAYCYEIFNGIENEKNDNGSPTLTANILMMMHYKGNNEKISNSFEQGYETIRDLNLSYEDDEKILEILKNSIELHFSDHEYTNDGAINFAIDYIHDLYDSEILDYFLYEIDDKNKNTAIKSSNFRDRENMNHDLYDEIKQVADEAINQLNKLKEKYSEGEK